MNSTNVKLHLSGGGAISNSILKAAGPEIQNECSRVITPTFTFGDVISTGAYQLTADVVYHGALLGWNSGAAECERVSRIVVIDMFVILT